MPGRSPWRRNSDNRISTGGSAVEYKINPGELDPGPAEAFRSLYPDGSSYVVTLRVREPYRIRRRGIAFTMCAPHHMQAVRQAGDAGAHLMKSRSILRSIPLLKLKRKIYNARVNNNQ